MRGLWLCSGENAQPPAGKAVVLELGYDVDLRGQAAGPPLALWLCHRHIPGVAGKLELRGEQCLGTWFLFSISGHTVHYDLEEDILHQQPMALSS